MPRLQAETALRGERARGIKARYRLKALEERRLALAMCNHTTLDGQTLKITDFGRSKPRPTQWFATSVHPTTNERRHFAGNAERRADAGRGHRGTDRHGQDVVDRFVGGGDHMGPADLRRVFSGRSDGKRISASRTSICECSLAIPHQSIAKVELGHSTRRASMGLTVVARRPGIQHAQAVPIRMSASDTPYAIGSRG